MFPHLKSQRVNLQLLQEAACNELLLLLDKKIVESKAIILDANIRRPFGLITPANLFRERDIKIYKLDDVVLPRDILNIIYIVRADIATMNTIATQILQCRDKHFYHILFVPRISCFCKKQLELKGVFGSIKSFEELKWNFLPIDSDVISMELPYSFRDVNINGDTTSLYQAALGLVQLQRLYGRIPKIYGKGQHSQRVWDYAKQLGSDEKLLFNGDKGLIDQLILFDRSIDIMSALATQLTYEGLIDEFYGIQQNQLLLPIEMFKTSSGQTAASSLQAQINGEKKLIYLTSDEKIYAELRNKNFNEVGYILKRKVEEWGAQMNTSKESVSEIKRITDKLTDLVEQKHSIVMHATIAESLQKLVDTQFTDDLIAEQEFMMCADIDKPSNYIEDLIARKTDLRKVLRFICLQCAAGSGLKEKVLNYYKRELAHVYGIDVLLTISNLERAGLLQIQTDTRAYAVLRKTFNLTVDDAIEIDPKDISYVHSFYAPLTVRIVEQRLKPSGWQSLKSQINCLPGPTFDDFQAQLIGIGGRQTSTPSEVSLLNIPRVILILFVGGCTFAEIAALRFLSKQEDNNVEFLIATTKLINKHTFLDSVMK